MFDTSSTRCVNPMQLDLADEQATLLLGRHLASCCPHDGFTLHLEGQLGAGKTTLTRGLLHALGHTGHVKSPTYTLVEPYDLASGPVFHFDLYRLADPEELDYLGIDDYFNQSALCLIEWPSQAGHFLPPPDLHIDLQYRHKARQVTIQAMTNKGQYAYQQLQSHYTSP